MILPLGTDRPLSRQTIVTYVLIAANLATFLALQLLDRAAAASSGEGEAGLAAILDRFAFEWKPAEPWRLVTYAFIHGGWGHLLGNLLSLWVFGPNVEDRLGRIWFIVLYLAGAACGALGHLVMSNAPLIGASGAIAAVTGTFLILFPRTHVRTFVFFIFVGMFHIPALWFIGASIAKDVLWLGSQQRVSHAAHVGGYVLGAGVALVLLWTKVLPREMFDLFSILQRKQRLKEIRSAAEVTQDRDRRIQSPRAVPVEEAPIPDAIQTLRADVSSRLARGDAAGAATAFTVLMQQAGANVRWLTMSRQSMLALGERYHTTGDHARAAAVYGIFLDAYPRDPQHAHTSLLSGLIHARYLGKAQAARSLIDAALPRLKDPEEIELANALLAELKGGGGVGGVGGARGELGIG